MAYLLKKEDFPLFVRLLAKSYDVIGPAKKKGLLVFASVNSASELDLSKNTYYPPKQFLFPSEEEILQYRRKRSLLRGIKEKISSSNQSKKQILLGVRMCDVSAIAKMDKFYSDDPYYQERRQNTYVVALKCNAEENDNCFCSSFVQKDEGYDLYVERVDEGFIVEVKTDKGKSLVDKKVFKASAREVTKGVPVCRKAMELKSVQAASPAWRQYSDKCLSCCACNIVCPTCTCFDIKDMPNLDLLSGVRTRIWDYCQSADYTRVAGNHIFRQGREARFRHRLLCKFQYFKENYDEITCTGCGRCITVCPTDVCDIPKIMGDVNG